MFTVRRPVVHLVWIAIFASVLSLARAGDPPTSSAPSASQPSSQSRPAVPDPERFAGEIRAFAEYDRKNTPPKGAVLFVGSSSIRMWATVTSFPQWTVINRGFGGSQITDVLHYFDHVVTPYDARAIVFYAGDNDVAEGRTPEQVCDSFSEFVQRVRVRQATVPIFFLAIKPSAARWHMWPQAQRANELVRDYCGRGPHLHYVDVASILLGADGRPDPSLYMPDALHLNEAGYAAWTRLLTRVLAELGG